MSSQLSETQPNHSQYTVAILCALDKELLAVRALFDAHYADLPTVRQDTNHYILGRIGKHNIVSMCLALGEYGTNSAANAVSHLSRSFPNVEVCLLVGIGGGVPNRHDIRLGDVVVGQTVLQYDLGKELENGTFQRIVTPQRSSQLLRKAISALKSDPRLPRDPLATYIRRIVSYRPEYGFPGRDIDRAFPADQPHRHGHNDCGDCGNFYYRKPRVPEYPKIHYGMIASGNKVIKSAKVRDELAAQHDILCFEMEAAGVIHEIPSLVIRGICDYADSHKNDVWQEYASAAAAAYARLLLSVVRGSADQEISSPQSSRSIESETPQDATYEDRSYVVSPRTGRYPGYTEEGRPMSLLLQETPLARYYLPMDRSDDLGYNEELKLGEYDRHVCSLPLLSYSSNECWY
ncbi:hypothetical protein FE257_004473 [Aspergillus nanangensis]|uniref:Nucleoside phosphorylase domain-containing protein n=1 Tax=Aspergillus nanangensis TaxID=2582783 RepID=A0AAD4GZ99_ASPNN|nr:hypothetical protein FE257_004473 [Aspergillus nanangensis]